MKKQYEVLQWASLFLRQHHCEETIAEILLIHHLKVTRSKFFMMMRDEVPEAILRNFKVDIKKHIETGIPVQHLLGYEIFYGRCFSVNKHVLIPRPETEEIVQQVIKMSKKNQTLDQPLTIVDVGTGSGVIAATLALEIPHAKVYATDISEQALKVAKQNANQLGAEITFIQGDFLQPAIKQGVQASIIVSNPPYIDRADEQNLSRTVKNFDPSEALFADDHGLAAYQQIIKASSKVLKKNGVIVFEIGFDQAFDVSHLVQEVYPQSKVSVRQDINKKDRMIIVKL